MSVLVQVSRGKIANTKITKNEKNAGRDKTKERKKIENRQNINEYNKKRKVKESEKKIKDGREKKGNCFSDRSIAT